MKYAIEIGNCNFQVSQGFGETNLTLFGQSLRYRSFVLCGQGFSLLWTLALRPFESVQCASLGRRGDLIGVCGVRAM